MGSKILYYFIIYPISLLPFFILYRISDILAFVFEYIVGYRKKVIYGNLKNSFPNKTEKELKKIQHKFYTHFSDLIVESLKGFNLSEKTARKRISFEGIDDLESFYKEGKSILLLSGHYGNWEMPGSALPLFISHLPLAIYKPLKNEFFNNKIKNSRSAFGDVLCSMKDVKTEISKDLGKPKAICFATDQSPSNPEKCYWTTFLNQETGVLFGAEKYAKELDYPVIYMTITKPKRGYYHIICTTLFENPKETSYGEITEIHTKFLEKEIIAKPEFWLWSHKRWKHKRPKNT